MKFFSHGTAHVTQTQSAQPSRSLISRGWCMAENMGFELLSDPDNKIQQKYGAYGEKSMYGKTYMGTIRSTFVVDKTGKLEHAFHNVKAKGHIEFLRKQLGL